LARQCPVVKAARARSAASATRRSGMRAHSSSMVISCSPKAWMMAATPRAVLASPVSRRARCRLAGSLVCAVCRRLSISQQQGGGLEAGQPVLARQPGRRGERQRIGSRDRVQRSSWNWQRRLIGQYSGNLLFAFRLRSRRPVVRVSATPQGVSGCWPSGEGRLGVYVQDVVMALSQAGGVGSAR
jgi:hypothetical protein